MCSYITEVVRETSGNNCLMRLHNQGVAVWTLARQNHYFHTLIHFDMFMSKHVLPTPMRVQHIICMLTF